MADPLSTISSIIGITTPADQIITRGAKFLISARDLPREITTLIHKTSALSGLLSALHRRVPLATSDAGTDLVLMDCEASLKRVVEVMMKSQLKQGEGIRNAGKRMMWGVRKEEVAELMERLGRCKVNLQVALAVDGMEAVQQVVSSNAKIAKRILDKSDETIEAIWNVGVHVGAEIKRTEDRYEQSKEDECKLDRRRQVLRWLSTVDYNAKQREVQHQRCENTGSWFLQSAGFKAWLEPDTPCVLWCEGMPGAGKTFMTSTIVDYLTSRYDNNTDVAIAHIYFNFKERTTQTPEMTLTALLHQLLSYQLPSIHSHITSLYEKFQQPGILFDALDECDEDQQRRDLLTYLQQLSHSPFKILVTSRPHPRDMNTAFKAAARMTIFANSEDIETVIRTQITEAQSRGVTVKPDLTTMIVDQIILKAQGMFLLAAFQIKHILQQPTQKKMRAAARGLGSDINATYGEVMDSIMRRPATQRELALDILAWITTATRPLYFRELQQAVAIGESDTEVDGEAFLDRHTMIDLCGSLVTIEDERSTVRLVHYTAEEYLREHTAISHGAHLKIANSCLVYLSFDLFDGRYNSWKKLRQCYTSSESSFLHYAVNSWSQHMKAIDEPPQLVEKAMTLLTPFSRSKPILFLMWDSGNRNFESNYARFENNHYLHLAARLRLVHLLSRLIVGHRLEADALDSQRRTPLSWAAEKGHLSVLQWLVHRPDVDADAKDQHCRTPLAWAAYNGHQSIVEFLLDQPDIDVDLKESVYGLTPFAWAAQNGYLGVIEVLIDRANVNVESRDHHRRTPLSRAAVNGHEGVVELLISRDDVDAGSVDSQGQSALSWAAKYGHRRVVELLARRPDVDVDAVDIRGWTSLAWAAYYGHQGIVEALMDRPDVDADSKDEQGRTPLFWAGFNGHRRIVEMLIKRPDVDADPTDKSGRSSLSWAAYYGHLNVVEFLVGRLDVDARAKDKGGQTPLDWAACNGQQSVVEFMHDRLDDDMQSRVLPLADEYWHQSVVDDIYS